MIRRQPRSTLFPSTPLFRSDTKLDRPVAIKLLPPQLSGDEDRLRRFRAEARNASALNHPNILVVQDRKSTRLNSSHLVISYAVFCLKKKNKHFSILHQRLFF